jgi:hypothetical protein
MSARRLIFLAQLEGSPIQNIIGSVEVDVVEVEITDENRLPHEPAEAKIRAHHIPLVSALARLLAQLTSGAPAQRRFETRVAEIIHAAEGEL